MENKSKYVLITTLTIIWIVFTGCYPWISRPGPPPFHEKQESHYFKNVIDQVNMNNVTYKLGENSIPTIKGVNESDRKKEFKNALDADLILRFAWLSDVHIIQRELKFGSRMFSSAFDEIVSATEFNEAQADFNWAVYLSHIAAINALNRDIHSGPVDFMINTGDSVNTGSIEELYQFVYISNKLEIPWLNVVGNHDTTIFGNYKTRLGYGHDPKVNFFPIKNLGNFAWMHRSFPKKDGYKYESMISGYGRHLLPLPENCVHKFSIETTSGKKLAPTFLHGFDLRSKEKCDDKTLKDPHDDSFYDEESIGDYATDLSTNSIPVRLIVLNSARKDGFGSEGSIETRQCDWLKCQLLPEDRGINLIFFHHRPKGFAFWKVKKILANHGGTVVLFTGHVHPKSDYNVTWYPGKHDHGFYELNTGSILEFPQIGRIIELRRDPGGRVWLIARALWNNHMKVQEEDDLPSGTEDKEKERKAVLGCCTNSKNRETIQNNAFDFVHCEKYNVDAVRCGNYGAYDDYLANQGRTLLSRSYALKTIWENANMIFQIYPPKPIE